MLFLKKTINRFILPFLNLLSSKNSVSHNMFLYSYGWVSNGMKIKSRFYMQLEDYAPMWKSCVDTAQTLNPLNVCPILMRWYSFYIKISSRCMKSDVKNKHQSESSNVCFYTNFILLSLTLNWKNPWIVNFACATDLVHDFYNKSNPRFYIYYNESLYLQRLE